MNILFYLMPYAHIFLARPGKFSPVCRQLQWAHLPTLFADLCTMSEKCPATTAAGQGKTKNYFEMCNRSKCKTKRTQKHKYREALPTDDA